METTSSSQKKTVNRSTIVTARHMADAVSYLTRVASESGLNTVAGKLTSVRRSLLRVVDAEAGDDTSEATSAKNPEL